MICYPEMTPTPNWNQISEGHDSGLMGAGFPPVSDYAEFSLLDFTTMEYPWQEGMISNGTALSLKMLSKKQEDLALLIRCARHFVFAYAALGS
jgi:hypothetical protein